MCFNFDSSCSWAADLYCAPSQTNKHGQRLQCSHYRARGLTGKRWELFVTSILRSHL